jgi:transposase InsO family protein
MVYVTKWLEVYTIPNQEASTVAEALVAKFFWRFGIPQELHSDQGCNFAFHLLQEVLQCLGVSKMCTTPLHPQSDGIVECYINRIEEHLWKVIMSHQRDWDERLPLFLLAYRTSTHNTTGLTPASLVFGRELQLPCDLLFGVPSDKERPTTDYAADLVDHLHSFSPCGKAQSR